MGEARPAAKVWEPLWLGKAGPPPYTVKAVAVHLNTGTSEMSLECSCACEFSYGEMSVPLDELNADAAEHLRGHG